MPAPRYSLPEIEIPPKSEGGTEGEVAEGEEGTEEAEPAEGEEEVVEEEEEGREEVEEGDVAEKEAEEVTETVVAPTSGKKRKLINQFNFCERAALTFCNPKRVFFF